VRRAGWWGGLALLAAACAHGGAAPMPLVPSTLLENEQVRRTMTAALEADAAGTPADSLYLIGAIVIADGLPVTAAPRFAGVQPGGAASVTGTTLEVTPYLAWGVLDYQWTPSGRGRSACGRATFVLERAGGSWRIKHLHSSALSAR
jgi:SnoaL-like domain